jgi:hypothetical protein
MNCDEKLFLPISTVCNTQMKKKSLSAKGARIGIERTTMANTDQEFAVVPGELWTLLVAECDVVARLRRLCGRHAALGTQRLGMKSSQNANG